MRGEFDAGVATGDGDGGGQIASGAIAGHADARQIAAEFGDAFDDVAHGGKTVLERTGKAGFRRPPVVDGDDDGAGLDRQQARLPVMGFEIAGDPAAAMEKHHRRRFLVRDAIDPRRQKSRRAFHFRIGCARDRRRRNGGTRRSQRAERIARALWRHRFGIAQRQQWNDLGDDGIERRVHAAFPDVICLRQHRFGARRRQ